MTSERAGKVRDLMAELQDSLDKAKALTVCETCGGRLRYVSANPKYGLEAKALHYLGDSNFVSDRCPGAGR